MMRMGKRMSTNPKIKKTISTMTMMMTMMMAKMLSLKKLKQRR
jgi:hypothetical protein